MSVSFPAFPKRMGFLDISRDCGQFQMEFSHWPAPHGHENKSNSVCSLLMPGLSVCKWERVVSKGEALANPNRPQMHQRVPRRPGRYSGLQVPGDHDSVFSACSKEWRTPCRQLQRTKKECSGNYVESFCSTSFCLLSAQDPSSG